MMSQEPETKGTPSDNKGHTLRPITLPAVPPPKPIPRPKRIPEGWDED